MSPLGICIFKRRFGEAVLSKLWLLKLTVPGPLSLYATPYSLMQCFIEILSESWGCARPKDAGVGARGPAFKHYKVWCPRKTRNPLCWTRALSLASCFFFTFSSRWIRSLRLISEGTGSLQGNGQVYTNLSFPKAQNLQKVSAGSFAVVTAVWTTVNFGERLFPPDKDNQFRGESSPSLPHSRGWWTVPLPSYTHTRLSLGWMNCHLHSSCPVPYPNSIVCCCLAASSSWLSSCGSKMDFDCSRPLEILDYKKSIFLDAW